MGLFAQAAKKSQLADDPFAQLSAIAEKAGVGEQAEGIVSKAKKGTFSLLRSTLDILQRPNFAVAGGIKNVIDADPKTTLLSGIKRGITGEDKETFTDVLQTAGFNPQTKLGKVAKGTAGFALDVLLDPITYLSLGTSAGAKAGKAGVTLSKEGTKFLQKAGAIGGQKGLSKQLAGDAIVRLTKKNPELAKKWIDQGGLKFFGKSLISGDRINTALKAVPGIKTIDRLTAPARNTVGALFNRNIDPEHGKLPNEFIRFEQGFRDLAKTEPAEALKRITNIARANKVTAEEASLITNAIEAGTRIADPRLENAKNLFKRELGQNIKDERARGIKVGELTNYVPHMLVKEDVPKIAFKAPVKRIGDLGFKKKRKIEGSIADINKEFGKEFFNENIIESTALRGLASKKAQLGSDFLREAAENFGYTVKQAPSNYIKSTAKGLENFRFHPAIAKRIDDFSGILINDEATSKLLQAFDNIQNVWKASVTSIFPAFHGRNAISNVFLNFMDMGKSVFNPSDIALSTSMLVKNRKMEALETTVLKGGDEGRKAAKELSKIKNQVVMRDNFGTEWTTGALRSLTKRNNIALTEDFFAADLPSRAEKIGVSTAKKVLPIFQDFYGFKKGREIGGAIEGQARMQNFFHHLKNTGDPVTAAERTKRFLFDYGNLTEFEKNFMRRLMPFYTFTRKNLENNIVEGIKRPGRVAAQAKVFNSIGDILSNADQATDEEIKSLPEWMQKGLLITLDRKGTELSFVRNLGLPLEQSLGLEPKTTLDMMSPLLKFPLERVTNRDLFREEDIKDVTNATAFRFAPEIIKDFIGYREVLVTPKDGEPYMLFKSTEPRNMHFLANNPVGSRLWSTLGTLGNTSLPNNAKVLQQTTGLRPFTFNIEREAAKRNKEINDELEQLLIDAGVGAEFKKFFIPKDKKKELGL